MALISGTKLGQYEITSLLGTGGMGEVYRARDIRLDRTVAIKILPTHLSSNSDSKARFEREARAISSLNHPSDRNSGERSGAGEPGTGRITSCAGPRGQDLSGKGSGGSIPDGTRCKAAAEMDCRKRHRASSGIDSPPAARLDSGRNRSTPQALDCNVSRSAFR